MYLKVPVMLLLAAVPLISCTVDCNDTNTDTGTDKIIYARLARNLVHDANFTILGIISPVPEITGYPMSNVVSMSDGSPDGRATGYIYFLLPKTSLLPRAIKAVNKVTSLITTGDRFNCIQNPEYPTCFSVMISGSAVMLRQGTNEYALGMRAFISRHLEAIDLILSDNFLLYKLVVQYVFVISSSGKMIYVPLKDYFMYK